MTIIGIAGAIGSGKSFYQLKYSLELCETRQKQLVVNFRIDLKELYKYVSMPYWIDSYWFGLGAFFYELFKLNQYFLVNFFGQKLKVPKPRYPWLKEQFDKSMGVIMIPNPENLQALFIPQSVVCLDEAGVFLNSRDFAATPKALLSDLAQSRKDGIDLVWCAQFDEQVDKQFRLLTQFWVHCQSLAIYNSASRRPEIKWKLFRWFTADTYFEWRSRPDIRTKLFKTRLLVARQEEGFLQSGDFQLFKVFNSLARLDGSRDGGFISTLWQCPVRPPKFGPGSKYQYLCEMLRDRQSGYLDLFVNHSRLYDKTRESTLNVRSINNSRSRFRSYN